MERTAIEEVVKKAGKKVVVSGWVHSRRDHGKIIFIDLRDRTGLLQVVFEPSNKEAYKLANELRPEFVVKIEGTINKRPAKLVNDKIATGTVEMAGEELEILNEAKTPPFELDKDSIKVNEETRLKYRYLDLRTERMAKNMRLRNEAILFIRNSLQEQGFIEIQTPILSKSTPEGARDYLVPSRLHSGKFFALPQSPQQYKQLLMVAGFERYFQIAPCFRDEDARADRSPGEFYQLDLEMSFVEQKDILDLIEKLFTDMIKKVFPGKKFTQEPWPRLSHAEVMKKYNTDKPDLRKDKKDPDELAFAWIVDFPLFVQQSEEDYFHGAGEKYAPSHHMFTAPKEEDIPMLDKDPFKVKSYQHDLALNGYEVGGGSIRIHDPKIQEKIFDLIGFDKKQKEQFKHLLEAFTYGVPPHGGIAPGIDRLLMVLTGQPSLKEMIAFPLTGDARDPMMDAPSEVSEKQLKDVHIGLAGDVATAQEDETIFNKLQSFLSEKDIKHEVMVHKPVFTSKQAAKVRGTELRQGARAIIFRVDKEFIQVVCPADKKINEAKVKEAAKTKKLKIATEQEVKKATGCLIGAVPPFGHLFDLPVYVDKNLAENEDIAFNAGMNTKSIKMKYADWEKTVKPEVGEFS